MDDMLMNSKRSSMIYLKHWLDDRTGGHLHWRFVKDGSDNEEAQA